MIWIGFNKRKTKKVRNVKNTCYYWLICYIPEPIRKIAGGFKDKIVIFFKTNTFKQSMYRRGKKLSKPKIQNIKNTFNPFKGTITGKWKMDTWKIQLTLAINFISSKDAEEERVMHSRSNNVKLTSHNDAHQVVDQLFESLHSKYEGNLETLMRGSDFIFDSV